MKARADKRNKTRTLLVSMATSIGSTMGTMVGKANAAQKALSRIPVSRTLKSDGKKRAGRARRPRTRPKAQRG
jgi:hypothetical protein